MCPAQAFPARSGVPRKGVGVSFAVKAFAAFMGAFTVHAAHPPVKVATPCRGPLWERQGAYSANS